MASLTVPRSSAQGYHLVASAVCCKTAQFCTQPGWVLYCPSTLMQDNGLDSTQEIRNPVLNTFCGRNVGLHLHIVSPLILRVSVGLQSLGLQVELPIQTDRFCGKEERESHGPKALSAFPLPSLKVRKESRKGLTLP